MTTHLDEISITYKTIRFIYKYYIYDLYTTMYYTYIKQMTDIYVLFIDHILY